jgi:hypothetical protein
MPNPAASIFKQIGYKAEPTFGALPGQTLGQLIRRVQCTLDLGKDIYESKELRTDLQRVSPRHGVRSVTGKLTGELSCKSYADFMSAIVKRDFTAGVSAAAVSVTIAGAGPTYTVTRAAGSYLTDGFKIGTVIRLSVGALNAANISKNLFITALTATVATVVTLNASALVAEGPITGVTVTTQGKRTFVPQSGHTDKSFLFEGWHADLGQSEMYSGIKPTKMAIDLNPSGLSKIDFDLIGQDLLLSTAERGGIAPTAQYFTTPTAAPTTGLMSGVNGIVRVGGAAQGVLTGLNFTVSTSYSGEAPVGSLTKPFLFASPVVVEGSATAYFDSTTLRDAFDNETELDFLFALTADQTASSDFLAFAMHTTKLAGASKSDGEGGIVLTLPFKAALNSAGGAGLATELTTIAIQDSAA